MASNEDTMFHIINVVTGTVIQLDIPPQELDESHSANFNQINIQTRSTPLVSYSESSARESNMSIQLHDDYCKNGIKDKLNKLKALTYPEYTSSRVVPPKCIVRVGSKKFTARCTNVQVNSASPFDVQSGDYKKADVSLSFLIVDDYPLSASDVEEGAIYEKL